MIVLAIDAATATGWACGPTPLAFGTRDFGKIDRAALWHDFATWLSGMVDRFQPDVLAYERPFLRGAGSLKLQGLAVETEKAAYVHSLFVLGVSSAGQGPCPCEAGRRQGGHG